MDDQLALRISLFRADARVGPGAVDFVTAELAALEAEGHTVTEATAGMLTSHLVMAISRILAGTTPEPAAGDDHLAAELADHSDAVARARAVALRARQELGVVFPDSEVNFLGLHLAVLAGRSAP
ncbi:transcriptional antiterminator [Streptomyces sp. NPDC003691]